MSHRSSRHALLCYACSACCATCATRAARGQPGTAHSEPGRPLHHLAGAVHRPVHGRDRAIVNHLRASRAERAVFVRLTAATQAGCQSRWSAPAHRAAGVSWTGGKHSPPEAVTDPTTSSKVAGGAAAHLHVPIKVGRPHNLARRLRVHRDDALVAQVEAVAAVLLWARGGQRGGRGSERLCRQSACWGGVKTGDIRGPVWPW